MSNKANKGSFRIIGGKYKGRKFEFLPSKDLRPTPDRLRETLFNWLGQVIDRKTCLDLFSGTGSLGLESLSRGAQKVTFIEKNFEHFDKFQLLFTNALLIINTTGGIRKCDNPGPQFNQFFGGKLRHIA